MLESQPYNAATEQSSSDSPDVYYQLIEVGAIRSRQASHLEPEALVSFKAVQFDGTIIPDAEIAVQPIPMQLAASLVPGSIWSADGKFISEGRHVYSKRRILKIGRCAPILRRLSQLFPSETSRPVVLQTSSLDTWYAVLDTGTEKIIIPCFELLRAFCYQDAEGLSGYFFSRLSLNTLCWPIAEPTSTNGFTAHFCVASTLRRIHEAKVLAELLFNSHYRDTIQSAHAYLATAWHECKANRKIPQSYAKIHFKLGKDVTTEAYGIDFIWRNQKYFWVSRLVPSSEWYGFKKVIYHPLQDSPFRYKFNYPFSDLPQWAFRDILQGRRPTPKIIPVTELPDSFQHFKRGRQNISFVSDSGAPTVVKSFAWARRLAANQPPIFADNSVLDHLWARPNYMPNNQELVLPDNLIFQQLSTRLKKLGCFVNSVEVNNPASQFGPGRSILPYARAPYFATHLPDCRYRPVSIACVRQGGGNFYLLNFLENKDIVVFYRKSLVKLSVEECNDFLLSAINANFNWVAICEKLPYVEDYKVKIYNLDDGMNRLTKDIFSEFTYAISKYNKAIDFDNLLIESGFYEEDNFKRWNTIMKISAIFDKRYYAGNYIGEKFSTIDIKK